MKSRKVLPGELTLILVMRPPLSSVDRFSFGLGALCLGRPSGTRPLVSSAGSESRPSSAPRRSTPDQAVCQIRFKRLINRALDNQRLLLKAMAVPSRSKNFGPGLFLRDRVSSTTAISIGIICVVERSVAVSRSTMRSAGAT